MRLQKNLDSFTVWLSAADTYHWANGYPCWPCSTLSHSRLCATFDSNGLLDLTIDGSHDKGADIDCNELNAIVADLVGPKLAENHPAYFVAVGQFKAAIS